MAKARIPIWASEAKQHEGAGMTRRITGHLQLVIASLGRAFTGVSLQSTCCLLPLTISATRYDNPWKYAGRRSTRKLVGLVLVQLHHSMLSSTMKPTALGSSEVLPALPCKVVGNFATLAMLRGWLKRN